jgi:predicted amidophosphoribosyltransferase
VLCPGCARPVVQFLCDRCRASLRPAPERIVGDGLRVIAAFAHEGLARDLVHGLKYRGLLGFPWVVAGALADRVPPHPLVPVPRVLSRRLLHGVDPSLELARAISALTGIPIVRVLRPPLHAPRRPGRDHRAAPPRFRVAGPVPPQVVLVDDVVTTGGTLLAAASVVGSQKVAAAVAATVAREKR